MASLKHILILCVGVIITDAAKLPDYIHACSASSPELNECAKREAARAIPEIINGDKNFHLPTLNPLRLPEITIQASENLKVKLTQCVLSGLENAEVKDMKIDLNKKHIDVLVFIEKVNLVGECDINGRILILPIIGQGPANITMVGGNYHYSFDYDLVNKKGKEYIRVQNPQITYDAKRAFFHIDNLFGGDKRLGEEMNNFLNENWADVSHDLAPAVCDTISSIVTTILKSYFVRIPYEEIFLP